METIIPKHHTKIQPNSSKRLEKTQCEGFEKVATDDNDDNDNDDTHPSRIIVPDGIYSVGDKKVAPKLQKLSHRKVSINVARHRQRHQPGKTYSLVEMKFRQDKMSVSQCPLETF